MLSQFENLPVFFAVVHHVHNAPSSSALGLVSLPDDPRILYDVVKLPCASLAIHVLVSSPVHHLLITRGDALSYLLSLINKR